MTRERSHSRSGPGGTAGARDGAGGLDPDAIAKAAAAAAAGSDPDAAPLEREPLAMQPGREYVDTTDHQRVVDAITAERDEMRGDLQRIAADFENFKRRSKLQREQASAAAETRLLGELLTVIDDTERAIEHAAGETVDKAAVVEGLSTVHSRLDGVVRSHGLVRVDTSGQFDPKLHEAMMVQPAPDGVAEDAILQVLQSGWMHGDRVLRHARVIVAGGG